MEKPLRTLSIDSEGVSREGGECFESNPWKLVSIIGNWVGNDPRTKTAGPFQTLKIALTSLNIHSRVFSTSLNAHIEEMYLSHPSKCLDAKCMI